MDVILLSLSEECVLFGSAMVVLCGGRERIQECATVGEDFSRDASFKLFHGFLCDVLTGAK